MMFDRVYPSSPDATYGITRRAKMKDLQQKVKELRVKMRWTQEELARVMDVSLSTVQRWEIKGGKPMRLARRELGKLFRKAAINDE